MAVPVRMFGPLELRVNGTRLGPRDFGGVKPKQLLEALLLDRGRLVPKDASPRCCGPSGCRGGWRRRSRPTCRCCGARSDGASSSPSTAVT